MRHVPGNIGSEEAWQSIRWPICLETPPVIVAAGRSLHGLQGAERYLLPDLWSLHLYSYSATLHLTDFSLPIRPGSIGLTPPNTLVHYEFQGHSPHLYVHFRCGQDSPKTAPGEFSPAELIPAMQEAGADYERLARPLERCIGDIGARHSRLQSCVWATLCELADLAQPPASVVIHPAVRFVVSEIEMHLGERLSAVDLAQSAGVSYSHLARLFQQAFGVGINEYLRIQRVKQAEHMLRHSTISIKVIAAQVGIPDLHFFNKTIRRHSGRSPRQIRGSQ